MTENSNKTFTQWHEDMIKENHQRSKDNERDIEILEKTNIRFFEKFEGLCMQVKGLTKVLWFLGSLLAATLIGELVKSFL